MQSFIFSIVDDRYVAPTQDYVTVHDLKRAIELASERLVASAHIQRVTIVQGGMELCLLDRADLDKLEGLYPAAVRVQSGSVHDLPKATR